MLLDNQESKTDVQAKNFSYSALLKMGGNSKEIEGHHEY
jgi:hypothetical protein